jgi:hypothetical protein
MMLSVFAESMKLSVPVVTAVIVAATNYKSVPATTVASTTATIVVFSAAAFS